MALHAPAASLPGNQKEDEMTGPILVAYASRYGTTREVAEAIAATLRENELKVDVRPAGEVDDLGPYGGVVLGGGIYIGRWHRDARGFVRHFEEVLRRIPVAIFALGPVTEKPEDMAGSAKQLERNLARLPVEPFAVRVFGGAFDPANAGFPFNRMPAADVRDWDAIRSWAASVAERFERALPPALV
jgi:menaquinone-dependent protoporphyrinogen oxidase